MAATLSKNQQIFASTLAQHTGLDPRLIGAWIVAEEPAGANTPVGHKDQNWLNIANTDSKWYPGSGGVHSQDPAQAAAAAAGWLQGKASVPGFGKAAPGIQAFARTAGQPLGVQIRALQKSGWASSGYPDLPSLVSKVGASFTSAAPAAAAAQVKTTTTTDQQGLDHAQKLYQLGQILSKTPNSPFDIGPKGAIPAKNPLLAILPQTPPTPGDFLTTRTTLQRPPGGATTPAGVAGKVIIAAGADRPGVGTQPIVRNFVGLVAGSVGHPITITTGTNHNQMTVDGNVSDHWTGHAADIAVPVDSQQGDMIAGRALMLAGVPREQARKMAQQGGLYTLTPTSGPLKGKRVQIIWKTEQGGNHHGHVHVGIQG